MNRSLTYFAIACGIAASGQSLAHAQAGDADTVEIEGRCSYSARLAPLVDQGYIFVECDRLQMRRVDGGQVELSFSFPARLREIELRGTFVQTGSYEVAGIRLRSRRDWTEAEGDCEFDPPGSDYPAVVCVAKSGARFYVVNFEPET